jgi:hypothetical protein
MLYSGVERNEELKQSTTSTSTPVASNKDKKKKGTKPAATDGTVKDLNKDSKEFRPAGFTSNKTAVSVAFVFK